MTTKTLNAGENPALANDLVKQAMAIQPEEQIEVASINPPSDTTVILPGGYLTDAGEVIRTVEVRELNGRDEEAIAKSSNAAKVFATILSRATVSVGSLSANDKILDELLAGDRDAIMLGIFKATFGPTAEIGAFCSGCTEMKQIEIDIDEDIKVKGLMDPIADRKFLVQGKKSEFLMTLPNGALQRELAAAQDKSLAELNTLMLERTVMEIDGQPLLSKFQVQSLGLMDRRTLGEEIAKRNPGPQFEDQTVICPDCEGEVIVPINLGTLFRI